MLTDHATIFDSVVRNAIDFLERSVAELESAPKYSVIHFCTSLELFLKARLMTEHWSLVLRDPRAADINKFENSGNFKTVGMEEAIHRLDRILGHRLGTERDSFTTLRQHRNQLVHFYNDAYVNPTPDTLTPVVAEQCTAWFHLHRLLTDTWKAQFDSYISEIERLDRLMRKHRDYLKAAFGALNNVIVAETKKGVKFVDCLSCGFTSSRVQEEFAFLYWQRCLVCKHVTTYITATCPNPDCGSKTPLVDEGRGSCEVCGEYIDVPNLIDEFRPEHQPTSDEPWSSRDIYCHYCEDSPASVVEIDDGGTWLCLNCLEVHDDIDQCQYCSELFTGDADGTYLTGCVVCDGKDFRD